MTSASKRLLAGLGLTLVISLLANVGLAWFAREQYRRTLRVRLDPSALDKFGPLNAALTEKAPQQQRVVFVGASRMEMWRELPALPGLQMINRGQSGEASAQTMLRLERDVLALKPDIVFVEIGVNDLKAIGAFPHEEQNIVARLKRHHQAIVARLSEAGVQVVISTIFPFGDVSLARRPVWSERTRVAREEVNAALRALKRSGTTVFDADLIFGGDGTMDPRYQLDELHLNEAGYRALTRAVSPLIERIARARKP
jgi:lysophospholipase L1-like esterase